MSDLQKELDIMKNDAAIDARGLLGVRANHLHLYQSSNSTRAKLHLMMPESDGRQSDLLCGSTITGNLINDEVGKDWLQSANLAPEGLCLKCLKSANEIICNLA